VLVMNGEKGLFVGAALAFGEKPGKFVVAGQFGLLRFNLKFAGDNPVCAFPRLRGKPDTGKRAWQISLSRGGIFAVPAGGRHTSKFRPLPLSLRKFPLPRHITGVDQNARNLYLVRFSG